MFFHIKSRAKDIPEVNYISFWEAKDEEFYAPGVLIRVKNGKGYLYERFCELVNEKSYSTLMFRNKALFWLQGNEYFCSTCEKILRSGYQLEQTVEYCSEKRNEENIPFKEALEDIRPLLGLLKDNYYVILDTELYPTDGNGNLFWDVPNTNNPSSGTCIKYMGDGEWGKLRPHFTVATQSARKLSKERVAYYREHPNCRAIAYYMDGYMTALIDGHHKTMAAALEHRTVKALVIMPCYSYAIKAGALNGEYVKIAAAGDMRFDYSAYGLDQYEKVALKRLIKDIEEYIPEGMPEEPVFPYDSKELASHYPTADEVCYMDEYGYISDERISRIIAEEEIIDINDIWKLMRALGAQRHARLFEVADFFLRRCSYTTSIKFHDWNTIEEIIRQLVKLSKSDKMREYMIETMVEYEEEYPEIKNLILDYL